MLKVVKTSSRPYLLYTESGSKNHTGGLNQRKVTNKVVKAFANLHNPTRCIVRLYENYMALRPDNAPSSTFYLQPFKRPRPNCWYRSRAAGHNHLSQTLKQLCGTAGITRHFTNHSLRRTCATRLYQQGADEQLIMSITGHRSKDGVRTYKEISGEQQKKVSEMIQPAKRESRDRFSL